MKKIFPLFTLALVLLMTLCACGAMEKTAYDMEHGENELDVPDAAYGYESYNQVPDTNGYNVTNGAVRYGSRESSGNTNATANATLHGSYNAPTGMRGMAYSGRDITENELDDPYAEDVRYRLMLDNAAVHDSDGFLFDEENPHHDTF